jgi:hypothetical protein
MIGAAAIRWRMWGYGRREQATGGIQFVTDWPSLPTFVPSTLKLITIAGRRRVEFGVKEALVEAIASKESLGAKNDSAGFATPDRH